MKKLLASITTALILFTFNPVQSVAAETRTSAPVTNPVADKVKLMETRLNEINAMDKSKLSRTEKKELRKEVRTIKKEMKTANSGGVFLSVGALVLIIILLVVLL